MNSIDEHDDGTRAWVVRAPANLQPPRGIERLKLSSEQRPDGLLHCLERLDTSLKDSEWTVQYAAVVSLQALMTGTLAPESGGRISRLLQERRSGDDTLVVRLRALHALERLVA